MSAHGPYVLQDGPMRTFWRERPVASIGVAQGEWVAALCDATRFPNKAEAEHARAARRISGGRGAANRIHIVPLADARQPTPRNYSSAADTQSAAQ